MNDEIRMWFQERGMVQVVRVNLVELLGGGMVWVGRVSLVELFFFSNLVWGLFFGSSWEYKVIAKVLYLFLIVKRSLEKND